MNRHSQILGCILGTAVADAVGLKREGLSKARAQKIYSVPPLNPDLFLGRGMCSDDTEHTVMVGRALVISGGDVKKFERQFARELKRWFLCMPAGVGFATLRACLKLLVGVPANRSGVYSAGNGPAMRSALLGLSATSETHMIDLVHASTRMTHRDPRAEEGALLIARAARCHTDALQKIPIEFLTESIDTIQNDELKNRIIEAVRHLKQGSSAQTFAESQGWSKGVTGYINQTVPAALYCWARNPKDLRHAVEDAVMLGGDTDTVAAITGAICGANLGVEAIPDEWLDRLKEWPRTRTWMERLATNLSETSELTKQGKPPAMHWLATIPRNVFFAIIVITLGFRRILPPY